MVDTAVVLAAGEGTRLRPLTRNRPKPMLPAATRPILEYVLDAVVETDLDRVVLVVGYRRDRVQEHFGPTYRGIELTYVHQRKQLGSAHALLQARAAVDGPLVVLNGDRVLDPGIVADVVDAFEATDGPTMGVLEHPDPSEYGAIRLSDGRVTEIVEKPTDGTYRLINAGVYAFGQDVFDAIDETPRREGELRLPDTIAGYVDRGSVTGVPTDGLWVDATYPWDLLYVTRRLLEEGWIEETGPESPHDFTRGAPGTDADRPGGTAPDIEGAHVAPSALIHDQATLQPPVVVGPDSEVAAGAVVGPDVSVGRNATVGANATVARSVLDADVRVGPGTTLLDCVAGQDVEFGAGVVVPGGPADVRVGDRVFSNQRLGAVFADRVRVGGGVTAAPGTLVGPNARLATGVHVEGWVREGAEVVR